MYRKIESGNYLDRYGVEDLIEMISQYIYDCELEDSDRLNAYLDTYTDQLEAMGDYLPITDEGVLEIIDNECIHFYTDEDIDYIERHNREDEMEAAEEQNMSDFDFHLWRNGLSNFALRSL